MGRLRPDHAPPRLNATSSVSATIGRLRPIVPAANTASSNVTAAVSRGRPIAGAAINATSRARGTNRLGTGDDEPGTLSSVADCLTVNKFTLSEDGLAIRVRMRAATDPVTSQILPKCAVLYADSSGTPGALLAVSAEVTLAPSTPMAGSTSTSR